MSLLAVFEVGLATLIVGTVLIFYAMQGASPNVLFSYLVGIVLIGPLGFLRTHWSEELGLELYAKVTSWVKAVDAWQEYPTANPWIARLRLYSGFAFFLILVPILMMLIRTVSVAVSLYKHFWDSVFAIPDGWFRTLFVLDVFYPPETVPGIESNPVNDTYRCGKHLSNAFSYANIYYSDRSAVFRFVYTGAWLLQWVFLFVPAIALRFLVKATCVPWGAIVFWSHARLGPTKVRLDERLDYILKSPGEIFARIVAFSHISFVAGLLLLHAYVSTTYPKVDHVLSGLGFWGDPSTITINVFVVCTLISSALTAYLWLCCDRLSRRRRLGFGVEVSKANNHLARLMFMRGLASVYLLSQDIWLAGSLLYPALRLIHQVRFIW